MARRRIIDDSEEEDMDVDVREGGNGHHQVHNRAASSSSSSPAHRQLRRRLETEAGVRPSDGWLDQCSRHLRERGNNAGNGDDEEAIWNQILHADLRDVVREPDDAGNSGGDAGEGAATAATQLRDAVLRSKHFGNDESSNNDDNPANNNNNNNGNGEYKSGKVTLPANFRLLIQMEEVIDVTMNAEQQLAAMGGGGGTAATGAANDASNRHNGNCGQQQQRMRNPKYRCLKMVVSDGHRADGRRALARNETEDDDRRTPLLAVETSPIRNLSTSSPPGLKLLLHGPIEVRLGLLQLNDENCAVLGGEVDGWKEVWKKAKERAQREKGLGVDPTIKALIWNPLMGDEEDADEGEGESGDVEAATPVPLPPPMQQAPPPPAPAQPIAATNQPVAHPNTNIRNSYQNIRSQSQSSNTANASSRGSGGGGNLRQRTLDAYPKKPRPDTTRLLPNNHNAPATANSRPTTQQASNNPYQRHCNNNHSGRNVQSNSNTRTLPIQRQQQQPPQPPPMQNNTNIIPIDDSPPSKSSHKTSMSQPQQQQRVKSNPYASLRPSSATVPSSSSNANGAPQQTARPSASAIVPSTFTSNPSFSELVSILRSLHSNRALYEQYYGKIITVPCKISNGPDKVFNIVKAAGSEKKKGKTKKEKKYEFLVVGKFLGPKQSDGDISCRVDSSVIAPYFEGYSPAEVRKLSREDKPRANRIVTQSTAQFVHDYSSLGQLQLQLMMKADEFFEKIKSLPSPNCWMSDTANPFLVVVKRN